jgi:hypothetical protein
MRGRQWRSGAIMPPRKSAANIRIPKSIQVMAFLLSGRTGRRGSKLSGSDRALGTNSGRLPEILEFAGGQTRYPISEYTPWGILVKTRAAIFLMAHTFLWHTP